MTRPRSTGSPALAAALTALEGLDALRRDGREFGRDYRRAFAAFVGLRDALTPRERAEADEYGQDLRRAYAALLVEQEASCPPASTAKRRDDSTAPRRRPEPTAALPGSEAKVRELARRRRCGMTLHSPEDMGEDPRRGVQLLAQRNGAGMMQGVGGEVVSHGVPAKIQPGVVACGFAARLRRVRREKGWGQQVLAHKSGLTQQFISLVERGERRPSIEAAQSLAAALGVSADVLLGLETAFAG